MMAAGELWVARKLLRLSYDSSDQESLTAPETVIGPVDAAALAARDLACATGSNFLTSMFSF